MPLQVTSSSKSVGVPVEYGYSPVQISLRMWMSKKGIDVHFVCRQHSEQALLRPNWPRIPSKYASLGLFESPILRQ
jgi:hypothetical protein